MIIHSPESTALEPYYSYVTQRAQTVAETLRPFVGDTNVQLCPRPILPHEQVFPDDPQAIIFGSVVRRPEDGEKSVLYDQERAHGIVAYSIEEAADFAGKLFARGDCVRFKDPRASDSHGQTRAETPEEAADFLANFGDLEQCGIIVMPHLAKITDRYAIAEIDLGEHGRYVRLGRELAFEHSDRLGYGGTDIGLVRADDTEALLRLEQKLQIPPSVRKMAQLSLWLFAERAVRVGYASVDVLEGYTDSGRPVADVIDLTSRVGGATPAEVEALAALHDGARIAYSRSRLHYSPTEPDDGKLYVVTPSLVITAQVTGTEGVYPQ